MRDAAEQLHRRQRHGVDADGGRGEQARGDHPVQQPHRRGEPRAEHQREPVAGDRVDPAPESRPEILDGENRASRPAGRVTFSSTRTSPDYPTRTVRPPRPGGSIGACPETSAGQRPRAGRPRRRPDRAVHRGHAGGPRPREPRWPSTTRPPARRSSRSANAAPDDGRAALDAAVAAQPGFAALPPRERGEILRRAYELITARVDDLALLMTLEMGKPLAEAKGEVAYAAEFFRWFAEEAVRIDGQYAVAPNGASRFLVMRQPVGVCLLVTPVELPDGHGHPQDRSRRRRRLHHGPQARAADPAVDARPRRDPRRGGPARRRAQRRHHLQRGRRSWSR